LSKKAPVGVAPELARIVDLAFVKALALPANFQDWKFVHDSRLYAFQVAQHERPQRVLMDRAELTPSRRMAWLRSRFRSIPNADVFHGIGMPIAQPSSMSTIPSIKR
jgi:hypothetical protein